MSEQIGTIKGPSGEICVTAFWGGVERGRCLQLTQSGQSGQSGVHFIQLSRREAARVLVWLQEFWVNEARVALEKAGIAS